jgi:hypothetical protein
MISFDITDEVGSCATYRTGNATYRQRVEAGPPLTLKNKDTRLEAILRCSYVVCMGYKFSWPPLLSQKALVLKEASQQSDRRNKSKD